MYEVFEHGPDFIVVDHLTGQHAGFALVLYDRYAKRGLGHLQAMPIAVAYDMAKRYRTRAGAQRAADRINGMSAGA